MSNYTELAQAVYDYYGASDEFLEIAKWGINGENAYNILSQTPGVSLSVAQDGSIMSYTVGADVLTDTTAVSGIGSVANSNMLPAVNGATTTITAPLETTVVDGALNVSKGVALKNAGNFVCTKVAPAVGAVATGMSLGKWIDKKLYEANPDFWDNRGLDMVNPDNWKRITADDDSFGATCINLLLGIKPDKTTQAYIDEDFYTQMALYMQQQGMFGQKRTLIDKDSLKDVAPHLKWDYDKYYKDIDIIVSTNGTYDTIQGLWTIKESQGEVRSINVVNSGWSCDTLSLKPFTLVNNKGDEKVATRQSFYGGNTKYYVVSWSFSMPQGNLMNPAPTYFKHGAYWEDCLYLALMGNTYEYTPTPMVGTTTQPEANLPFLDNNDTTDTAKEKLKNQYPDLWNKAVKQDVVQPDGTVKTHIYLPVPFPQITNAKDKTPTSYLPDDTYPATKVPTQTNPIVNPDTTPEPVVEDISKLIGTPPQPPENPPEDTGKGTTPIPTIPTGSASSLFKIYNPTETQIQSFGGWLWSSNFVDQILKMFSDPMNAIIGLHKIYATPSTGGATTIKVGYLDSNVASKWVDSQYIDVPCGSVDIGETFGNVFDYEPYTKISLYLPFVGIVPLSVGEVMRSTITIDYKIDVLTGACLVNVNVKRDNAGGMLYTYSGNCACQYPLSSGSYMGILSGVLGVAGSVVSGFTTGILPAVAGTVNSLSHAKTNVGHSGSLSGNAGAMGIKKPYLIITRPITAMAKNFNSFNGYPTNTWTKLGTCKGYTKVQTAHLNITGTAEEVAEIDNLLKSGVII